MIKCGPITALSEKADLSSANTNQTKFILV